MFRTVIIYLNCIKWLVTWTQCAYCEVGTELYCTYFLSRLLSEWGCSELVLPPTVVLNVPCVCVCVCVCVLPSASTYGTSHCHVYKILPLDGSGNLSSYLSRMKTVGGNCIGLQLGNGTLESYFTGSFL